LTRNSVRIDVTEESFDSLAEYAAIPISFEVRRVLDVPSMTEHVVGTPYVKDYDMLEPPTDWPARFDLSRWTLLVARVDGRRVGGAAIAFGAPGVELFDGRRHVAMLWDLRVVPELRGQGVGTTLFRAAEGWAATKGCTSLEVETQDINVPACRFYARMGCALGAIRPHAYAAFPDEVQLIWQKQLTPG
jgi:GNAT superfamily N-acetyltransferase